MDLKPISPTTTLTNALPKMYDNWQEFYDYWWPWISSTAQRHLSITQLENGVINHYEIDWNFVVDTLEKDRKWFADPWRKNPGKRLNVFLRNFWRKVGLPAG